MPPAPHLQNGGGIRSPSLSEESPSPSISKPCGPSSTSSENSSSESQDSTQSKCGGNVLVMDSAYCWVVCIAVSVQYFMNAMSKQVVAICFLEFVAEFGSSITITSLGFTFYLISFSAASLVVMNVVVPVTSERVAVVIGRIVGCACTIGVGLAPNIGSFLFFMSASGFCAGVTLVPSISMITQYFKKRRSVATAVAYCGVGVGCMASPPLVEWLFENFALKGTFLIIAAIELHSLPAAMLLRPRNRYKYVLEGEDLRLVDDSVTCSTASSRNNSYQEDCEESNALLPANEMTNGKGQSRPKNILNNEVPIGYQSEKIQITILPCDDDLKPKGINSHTSESKNISNGFAEGSESPKKAQNFSKSSNTHNDDLYHKILNKNLANKTLPESNGSLSLKNDSPSVYQETTIPITQSFKERPPGSLPHLAIDSRANAHKCHNGFSSNLSLNFAREVCLNNGKVANGFTHTAHTKPRKRSKSSSFNELSTNVPNHLNLDPDVRREMSSTWSVYSAAVGGMVLDVEAVTGDKKRDNAKTSARHGKGDTNGDGKGSGCWPKTQAVLSRLFCRELLKTWSMRILVISGGAGALAQYLVTYLPTLASKQGMDPSQVATLLTVMGAIDLISRIGVGFFADMNLLTPGQIVAITQIILGTVLHFVRWYTTYSSLMFLAVAAGLFATTRQNLSTLITIEFLGMERFLSALGFQVMVCMLTMAAHHPILSAILESVGSFAPPMHYVGFVLYTSAALVLTAPIARRVDARREAKNLQTEEIVIHS